MPEYYLSTYNSSIIRFFVWICVMEISDKIKREFCQKVAVSILSYHWVTKSLKDLREKNVDGNYVKMLWTFFELVQEAALHKSTAVHPSNKPFKFRPTKYAGHAWLWRYKIINMNRCYNSCKYKRTRCFFKYESLFADCNISYQSPSKRERNREWKILAVI